MSDRIVTVRLDEVAQARLEERIKAAGTNRSDVLRDLVMGDRQPGYLWFAYYADMSEVAAFDSEVGALRHAVHHNMEVIRVPIGMGLNAAINARLAEQRNR